METIFTDVGCRISKQIKDLGLRQLDICSRSGLSTTALSQYCTGKRIPDTVSLYKLATVLGVSMEWILTGVNSTTENSQEPCFDFETLKKEQGLLCDGSPLSSIESDLIAMFRLLPSSEQEDAFDIVHLKFKKRVERKKSSIYWTYFDESYDNKNTHADTHKSQRGTA